MQSTSANNEEPHRDQEGIQNSLDKHIGAKPLVGRK